MGDKFEVNGSQFYIVGWRGEKDSEGESMAVTSDLKVNAKSILNTCGEILDQRGAEYEADEQEERSFAAVAACFNAKTGKDLTPAHICLILQDLKDVRQFAQDRLHWDSVIDGVNYAALKGEELAKQYKIMEIEK